MSRRAFDVIDQITTDAKEATDELSSLARMWDLLEVSRSGLARAHDVRI